MRTAWIITALTVAVVLPACANGSGKEPVPEKVKAAFTAKFPTARNVKWDRENATEWEAEFNLDGGEFSANFSNEGTWMETEREMKVEELPVAVKTTLDTDLVGYKVEEAEEVETPNGVHYAVEVEQGGTTYEVELNAQGQVVHKEVTADEDED